MANFGGAASGAVSGASVGGSIGGPIGAGIGGLIGGVAGLFGKKKKKKKISAYDKQQQNLNDLEHKGILGEGPLADLYNYDPEQANSVFEQTIANPAYRKFKEEIIPSITGQFRNQGLMNSSYAGDALSKAGRDVQEGLDAKRSQYLYDQQQNSKNNKINAINNIQSRSTFGYDKSAPSNSGFDINSILNSITPDAIEGLKNYFGGK